MRARRLKQEERNLKRQEEAKRRQEEARIREEKKLHKKRARSRNQLQPTKPYIPPNEAGGRKYFGRPLSEVCSDERPIPVFVEQCAQLIEENGIRQKGIYRVSGKKDDILDLHAKFDDGKCTILCVVCMCMCFVRVCFVNVCMCLSVCLCCECYQVLYKQNI